MFLRLKYLWSICTGSSSERVVSADTSWMIAEWIEGKIWLGFVLTTDLCFYFFWLTLLNTLRLASIGSQTCLSACSEPGVLKFSSFARYELWFRSTWL